MDHNRNSMNRPFRRPSLRLPNYDYTSTGAYFVTICAKERKPIFEISELHQFILGIWQALPERFPSITLDEFVIMPDHVHGILWLDGSAKNAPALDDVISAYKSLTTVAWLTYHKSLGVLCSRHLWQQRYYEHIIRNDQDLEEKRQYIRNNPMRKQEREEAERLRDIYLQKGRGFQ